MIPNKFGVFLGVTQSINDLARLTLRQLRYLASELEVPLYSRKSKESLVKEIFARQEKKALKQEKSTRSNEQAAGTDESFASDVDKQTRVVFLPRDPEWAYVFWEISEVDRNRAMNHGASRLFLRLADVTGKSEGRAHQQTMQEVPVDSHTTEWYLPIPMCDRDYKVELGYKSNSQWISLAISSSARVPALHPSNQILDEFVPFSLDNNQIPPSETIDIKEEPTDSALHERLYQTATHNFSSRRIGSEEFQDKGYSDSLSSGFSDSGHGFWSSGRSESGVGFASSQNRSFWLVADAELIVYGATDPSAKLTIGEEEVPLSNDGTFRVQVPFRDGQQKYAIKATAIDGEQKRNITLHFQRSTPEDNSNPNQPQTMSATWF